MQPEELLGLAIPVIFLILLGIESRHAARPFEPVHHWRRTGLLFFAIVLVVGSLAPLLLPLAWFRAQAVLDISALGLWGIPVGLLVSTFFGYWLHRAEHRFDWLWRASHQLHHSAPRVDLLGAYFTHPVEVLLKVMLGTTVSICLLGLAPMAASAVALEHPHTALDRLPHSPAGVACAAPCPRQPGAQLRRPAHLGHGVWHLQQPARAVLSHRGL